jgi:hypothetical protein
MPIAPSVDHKTLGFAALDVNRLAIAGHGTPCPYGGSPGCCQLTMPIAPSVDHETLGFAALDANLLEGCDDLTRRWNLDKIVSEREVYV